MDARVVDFQQNQRLYMSATQKNVSSKSAGYRRE